MWLDLLLGAAALPLVLLPAWLLVEVGAAVRARADEPAQAPAPRRPRTAVLVPAHDERQTIAATVRGLKRQLLAGDRLLVVADNCSDETAALAAEAGAEVVERRDPVRCGKGYALDFGMRRLAADPPEVVIVVDADCQVDDGALGALARGAAAHGRPAQALYLMSAPPGAGLNLRIAEFAWRVKNHARALGLQALGAGCHLAGTGMAFPWHVIHGASLATGDLVEDRKLGMELAMAGTPPVFLPSARVTSTFPASARGAASQRTRWEHGHLSIILREAPALISHALRRRDARLLMLTLDLAVPPLALLVLAEAGAGALGGVLWWTLGRVVPLAAGTLGLAITGLAVGMAWARFGRESISALQLAYAPLYALRKVPLYLRFLVSRQVKWVRSERDEP